MRTQQQLKLGEFEIKALKQQLETLKSITPEPVRDPFVKKFEDIQMKWEKVKDIFLTMKEASETCKASERAVSEFEKLDASPIFKADDSKTSIELMMEDGAIEENKRRGIWDSIKSLGFGELRSLLRQYRVTKTVTVTALPAGKIQDL